ncbi:hypothetical protein, partial [Anabaenopsis arnoldii]
MFIVLPPSSGVHSDRSPSTVWLTPRYRYRLRSPTTVNGMANATLSLSTPLTDHRQPSTVWLTPRYRYRLRSPTTVNGMANA